jgi:ribonucleoside-triphosphate reductase
VISYYCAKEWGDDFYLREEEVVYKANSKTKSISSMIEQAFQNIVYSINQPAGNRSYQSPFTNVSYYDKNYWEALFSEFRFPDGSALKWEAVNYIQQKFMRWFNEERSKCLLTFPVETVALLSDGKDIIDKEYKNLVTEMYAKGHSFFTYVSDNADALSSCCRLKNKLDKNEFNFTNGLTGVATGSKSVITLNINRIVQDFAQSLCRSDGFGGMSKCDALGEACEWGGAGAKCGDGYCDDAHFNAGLKEYLVKILERVYRYHTAYNELLWELYEAGMLPVYSEGYIHLNQQFLTIGINGVNEAAEFLGMRVSDNPRYCAFCRVITSTIAEQNRIAEQMPYEVKHRLKFNTEFVPAENLGLKNYNWDKADFYWVPKDRNCYNSYFYKPDDSSVSVLEKFRLHGRRYVDSLDGGVALHCNLEEHLTQKQYELLLNYAVAQGTNYFTFNVPNSQCDQCGYISKHPIKECPRCKSKEITWWTRIIGYLRPIKNFSRGRREEASKRVYHQAGEQNQAGERDQAEVYA